MTTATYQDSVKQEEGVGVGHLKRAGELYPETLPEKQEADFTHTQILFDAVNYIYPEDRTYREGYLFNEAENLFGFPIGDKYTAKEKWFKSGVLTLIGRSRFLLNEDEWVDKSDLWTKYPDKALVDKRLLYSEIAKADCSFHFIKTHYLGGQALIRWDYQDNMQAINEIVSFIQNEEVTNIEEVAKSGIDEEVVVIIKELLGRAYRHNYTQGMIDTPKARKYELLLLRYIYYIKYRDALPA
jgi:hypothetical protein